MLKTGSGATENPGPASIEHSAFFDLSRRVKLRVTGKDRERFLNGQLTNDVRKAAETRSIAACILNPKGKLNAFVFVTMDGESFLLDADAELRQWLQPRLDRYLIADDVQLADESEQWSMFHVLGETAPALPRGLEAVSVVRFVEAGHDVWAEASRREELLQHLSLGATCCNSDDAEVLRIERGIPRWGRELTDEIIPIEANLEKQTIDYEKGCYIGQEVISRMKMSGQTNKKLCGLVSLNGAALSRGMKLFPASPETKEVGWVTSASWSQRLGKQIALAYVKRGWNRANTELNASDEKTTVPVEVVTLPFS
jgi:tRNA-modifying protein YgfZ